MRAAHIVFIAISLLCVVLLSPGHAVNAADSSIRIGGTLGLTGKYAAYSDMQLKGYRLWESDVNERGGILGRPVQVIIHDDQSSPERAVELYRRLILQEKVDLIFAPFSSEITLKVLPLTEQYKYPVLIAGASADRIWEQGYKYIFGLFLPASKITKGFLELLVMNGIERVAIVHASDPFSLDIAKGTKKWAEILGQTVVLYEPIPHKSKLDYSQIAEKIIGSHADVLISCGFLEEFVRLRTALDDNFNGLYYTPVGPGVPQFYERLKDRAEYVFSTSQWQLHSNQSMPGSKEFFERFTEKYGAEPSYFAATAYASGQLMERTLIEVKKIDREKIRNSLSRMYAASIIGRYGVDSRGIQIKNFNLAVQVQDGKTEVVWPEAYGTKQPIFK